jgi:thermolabile hemolysin
MKTLTSFLCLAALATHASAQDPRALASGSSPGDRLLDISTFELAAPVKNPSSPLKVPAGTDTYTYLRCHYRSDDGLNDTQTKYEWGTSSDGSWHKIPGYWHSEDWLEWRNVFYTDTKQAELQRICSDSLKRRHIQRDVVHISAASSALSLNFPFWTQAEPGDSRGTERIVVFGDSLSDTHNVYNLLRWSAPNSDAWFLGRFSNGPVWAEYLEKNVGLTVHNLAIGAATADQHIVPGFIQQVDLWIGMAQKARSYDPGKSLFYIMIGANDLINFDVPPDQSVIDIEKGLRALLTAGARKIVISNLPNVTRAPVFRIRRDGAVVAARVSEFNARLSQLVDRVERDYPDTVVLFDANAFFKHILDDPEQAGFSDAAQSCLRIDSDTSLNYLFSHGRRAHCTSDTFVFWDTLHPTTRMHEKVSRAMQEATPAAWLQ